MDFGGLQRSSLAFGLQEMTDEIRGRETSRMVERLRSRGAVDGWNCIKLIEIGSRRERR